MIKESLIEHRSAQLSWHGNN